jgi:hypothetical protein
MITVIICSINPNLLSEIRENIASTIGCQFELLAFDNRSAKLGICEVYNTCAKKSKFEYLCFVHEDVIFDSPNWGFELVEAIQSNPNSGVIGLAGSKYVPRNFISWGDCLENDRWNISHYSRENDSFDKTQFNPKNERLSQVTVLDGVLLFTRQKTWERSPFDESTFPGFHLYDADFSLSISQFANNYVCQTIQVRHLSSGQGTSRQYYKYLISFRRKWRRHLPAFTNDIMQYSIHSSLAHEQDNMIYLLKYERIHFGLRKSIANSLLTNGFLFFAVTLLMKALKKILVVQKHFHQ